MDLIARYLSLAMVLGLAISDSARAQLGSTIPNPSYFLASDAIYSGDYRGAERGLRRETQLGFRVGQTRWVDSICSNALLGEVLFQQGRNHEALASFDQACQTFLAFPDWLVQVRFQQPPRPDITRARRVPTWGKPARQFVLGQFSDTYQVLLGDINAGQAVQSGGVVRQPMFMQVNVVEVLRATALAIRRRGELLGPLAAQDPIAREISETLARGNLAPANHWSGAWIDILRGVAQSSLGNLDEADKLLARGILIDGRFDHPLTSVAFYEQGRIAMQKGDRVRAAQLFAEASYSAFYYENLDILTESVWMGWLNQIAGGGVGVYPPLDAVAGWAQANRLHHVATKLRLAQAESLLWMGQPDSAAVILNDVSRRIAGMRGSIAGIQLSYVQSIAQVLGGKIEAGNTLLLQALAGQARVSIKNFQIARLTSMYDTRLVSPRVAVDYFKSLLSDPSANEWIASPLDSMAVLSTPADIAFDRWFVAALERKEPALALQIAELAKRRRYLASLPLGGRVAALRTLLETPDSALSREALLQRQQIVAAFPAYRQLSDVARATVDQLRAKPIVGAPAADVKTISTLYKGWEKNTADRELLLAQLVLRRLATSIEFPPLRPMDDLQASLDNDETLVVFHVVANDLFGFVITKGDIVIWKPRDLRRLRTAVASLLQGLGNYGASRQLALADLGNDKWQATAADLFTAIFNDSRIDLATTKSLIIVPDEVLWYLPFEVLVPDAAQSDAVLADRFLVRYGPTASLAVSSKQPLRRPQHTGIVATPPKSAVDPMPSVAMLDELDKLVAGPVRLPSPLPEPPRFIAMLLDMLVSFDEVGSLLTSEFAGLPTSKGSGGQQAAWFGLPYGGPERIVLSGFSTAAEQSLKAAGKNSRRSRAGDEIFQYLCKAMGDGARTMLLTRWRTGGNANFELVREFVRELPTTPANESWQRACLLTRETPLDLPREPRLKRSDATGEQPVADHPFFWSGYLLVDNSPNRLMQEAEAEALEAAAAP